MCQVIALAKVAAQRNKLVYDFLMLQHLCKLKSKYRIFTRCTSLKEIIRQTDYNLVCLQKRIFFKQND